jgi:putative membrane protein insertion efficiency factor
MGGAKRSGRRRWIAATLAALLLVTLAVDLSRPPSQQVSVRLALASIRFYQAHLVGAVGRAGVRCRFVPSCSVYAATVIARFGALHGGWLAVRRLLRCGPWTPPGTFDPPPRNNGARGRGSGARKTPMAVSSVSSLTPDP